MCDDELSHELEVSKLKKKWGRLRSTSDFFRGAGVVLVWELWGLGGSGVEFHHSTLMWIWDADQLGNTWRNPSEIIGGRVTSWKSFLFFDHSWKQFCWKDFSFVLGNSGIYKCFDVVANELNEHRTLRQTQTWTLFPVVPSVLYNPIWVFPKKGGNPPKWMVKIMENPMKKWMIWGENPLFSETSILILNGGTQQSWVFLLKMVILGCFGGTTIFGNTHIAILLQMCFSNVAFLPDLGFFQ